MSVAEERKRERERERRDVPGEVIRLFAQGRRASKHLRRAVTVFCFISFALICSTSLYNTHFRPSLTPRLVKQTIHEIPASYRLPRIRSVRYLLFG